MTPAPPSPSQHRGPVCPGCGYCLDGLTSRFCPECGAAFDPDHPALTEAPKPCRNPWLLVGGLALLAASLAMMVSILGPGLLFGIGILVVVALVGFHIGHF